MPETQPSATAVAITTEPERTLAIPALQSAAAVLVRTGAWASDTAQQFGALVSALMGPAVFSGYALAIWSLAANLGWTDSFIFSTGPLSNWLVWLGIAILLNVAATILRRHTQTEP